MEGVLWQRGFRKLGVAGRQEEVADARTRVPPRQEKMDTPPALLPQRRMPPKGGGLQTTYLSTALQCTGPSALLLSTYCVPGPSGVLPS